MKVARRMASFEPFFFAEVNHQIEALRSGGLEVIRLDVGSPDQPPAEFIINALEKAVRRPGAHGYQSYGGTRAFRQAVATFYQRRFSIALDPDREVLGLIGSKEGIFNLSQALLDPGDLALVPDPAYPTYQRGTLAAGGEPYLMPLREEEGFLPDLDEIPSEIAQRASVLWLNYPNNPTGAIADLDFFQRVVDFAHQYRLLIAHDAPYSEVGFDGYQPPSLLQVPGAREVAVEFNSLSKAYNMAGWRLGMVVGNSHVIDQIRKYKLQVDSSHFGPIMAAGALALTADQGWLAGRNAIYQERRDIVLQGLRQMGFLVRTPQASLYVWARLPAGESAPEFCKRMLTETGVSVTPGETFGQHGKGYIRIALGTSTGEIQIAMRRMLDWRKIAD